MTNKELLKEIRLSAKINNLTFKEQNAWINGKQAYKFINRLSGETVLSNCTLGSAYEMVCSGYIDSYNKEEGYFEGVNCYLPTNQGV